MKEPTHSILIGLTLICWVTLADSLTANAGPAPCPNFLILMADDQYKPTLGCYGGLIQIGMPRAWSTCGKADSECQEVT